MQPVNQHLLEKLRLQHRTLIDADGRVSVDAPCRGCGYNLRGVGADGDCPECGHAVADALRDDRPEHSDPRWLGRVVLGANLAVVAGVVAAVNTALLILGSIIMEASSSPNLVWLFEDYLIYALLVALGLTWLLAMVACWLVTARDPARAGLRRETHFRWLARLGLAACVPMLVLSVWGMGHFYQFMGLRHRMAILALHTLPALFFGVGIIGLLLYLRVLTRRMAEWEIARAYNSVCFGISATTLGYVLANAMLALLSDDWIAPGFLCCGCDLLVAAGLLLWAILLADQTRRALNAAKRRVAEKPESPDAPGRD